jgi:hypothetical protein
MRGFSGAVAATLLCGILSACTTRTDPAASRGAVTPSTPRLGAIKEVNDIGLRAQQWRAAKDVFDRRCVVCHGCYDAPCQLILSSAEGLSRGASKTPVYDGARLLASEPTRLFVDAQSTEDWRKKNFFSVLPEHSGADPKTSLLVRMLELKRDHPLRTGESFPNGFELGIGHDEQCARADEFDDFAEEHPLWGMPYGLPGLSDAEHETLVSWLRDGTPYVDEPPLGEALSASVNKWEAFMNETSLKARLSARYIYEHLFLAHLYFEDVAGGTNTMFRMIRSRTPPGTPSDEIATRRPTDDPQTGTFFYRVVPRPGTRLAKTHMPYALSDVRLARYRELFIEPVYQVTSLPSYDSGVSANPFAAFKDIPVRSRYRFMLEEAEFTLMGFIKGPVCRGQIALNVIEDRFWVAFVSPESIVVEREAEFLANVSQNLQLPAEQGSNGFLTLWLRYARNERKYLKAKSKFLNDLARTPEQVNLGILWEGDGTNQNAALTVMRHFDSATVVKGFVGDAPKTAWLLGYPLLERIHYLLVAGFDVFGNLGHQLNTRMYMDFLRMEAEHNFIALLPKARRRAVVNHWYRNVRGAVKDEVYGKVASFSQESSIEYKTATPELELYQMMQTRLSPVLDRELALSALRDEQLQDPLERLATLGGLAASLMSETSYLEVRNPDGSAEYFTILRDSGHTNVAHLFNEQNRRLPNEDHLTVLRGFVGQYPNTLFSTTRAELSEFVEHVCKLSDEQAYAALHARFGIGRTNPAFWSFSDRAHAAFARTAPLQAGLFDFNRLEGR